MSAQICNSKLRIEGPARGEPTASTGCTSVPDVLPLVAVRVGGNDDRHATPRGGTRSRRQPPARIGRDRILMAGLVIEREVLIEAPAEVVWRTITEPDQMSQWFADRVDLVVEPGAHGFMQFGDQGGPVVVETVDPPARFSFRWNHPRGEEPVAGNSMLVEFTLTPEGSERTRLRVTESGHELLDWPDAQKQRYADEHQGGWAEFLDRLARVLAKGQPG